MSSSNLILQIKINSEEDILYVRQRTRQLSTLSGLSAHSQTRLITAVSEIVRNAIQYANGGIVRFSLVAVDKEHRLEVTVEDKGKGIKLIDNYLLAKPGIANTGGILAAKNLVHYFDIESDEKGTKVTLAKTLPANLIISAKDTLNIWTKKISGMPESSAIKELQDQNHQLIQALAEVQESQILLSKQQALLAQHTSQLEDANKTKGNFVANMSHEMRTPLNAIIGISDILTKTPLNKHQQFLVNSLDVAGRSLLSLINDILDLSKLEAGKFQIEDIYFDLLGTVREALSVVQPQALEKYVDLMLFSCPYIPTTRLHGDPHRIQQVIINILATAIKFSSQNSETDLYLFNVASDTDFSEVRFVILDTGIGISQNDQNKLFQAFSQLDGAANRKYGGSGLGLSICRHLVGLMNGEIGFISQKDVGTAVWFNIPFTCESPLKPLFREDLDKILAVFIDQKLLSFELLLKALGIRCKRLHAFQEKTKIKHSSKDKVVFIDDLPTDFASSKPSRLFNHLMEHCGYSYRIENFRSGREKLLIERRSFSKSLPKSGDALLVEDHAMNQMIGRLQLEELGFKVEVCSSGEEAIKSFIRKKFSIIFMDCQMPEMDGYEVTQEIRKLESQTQDYTPIIALTASALEGEREKCLEAGMDDYLSKPVEPETLYKICEKWLAKDLSKLSKPVSQKMIAKGETNLIDKNKLTKQFTSDQYNSLIKMYRSDSIKFLAELDDLFKQKNTESAIKIAHILQGASRMIYAKELADNYRDMEIALRSNDWLKASELLNKGKDQFDKIEHELANLHKLQL